MRPLARWGWNESRKSLASWGWARARVLREFISKAVIGALKHKVVRGEPEGDSVAEGQRCGGHINGEYASKRTHDRQLAKTITGSRGGKSSAGPTPGKSLRSAGNARSTKTGFIPSSAKNEGGKAKITPGVRAGRVNRK